jgi:hypothetical protein
MGSCVLLLPSQIAQAQQVQGIASRIGIASTSVTSSGKNPGQSFLDDL